MFRIPLGHIRLTLSYFCKEKVEILENLGKKINTTFHHFLSTTERKGQAKKKM